jgi:hypothetical protein
VDEKFTVTLPPLGSGINSTFQNPADLADGTKYSAYYGRPGDDGYAGNPDASADDNGAGGDGGNGGNGDKQNSHNACPSVAYYGGAGGIYGMPSNYDAQSGGKWGAQYYGAEKDGDNGRAYCPVSFEDGTSCDMNNSGYGGYNTVPGSRTGGDTTGAGTAGPVSSFMVYFCQ